MLTEKDYCDYDTCVALREVGCPMIKEGFLGLSLHSVQKWLREVHNLHIKVGYNPSLSWYYYHVWESQDEIAEGEAFPTYEDALQTAIYMSVEHLKENKMETKFNFNSQVCTSKSQSGRLLALGLKKETADMHYWRYEITGKWCLAAMPYEKDVDIPAWSLHRLIEMLNEEMYGGLLCIFKDSIRYEEIIMDRLEAHFEVVGDNMYENVISTIEWLIKEGYFNKEYLCEK